MSSDKANELFTQLCSMQGDLVKDAAKFRETMDQSQSMLNAQPAKKIESLKERNVVLRNEIDGLAGAGKNTTEKFAKSNRNRVVTESYLENEDADNKRHLAKLAELQKELQQNENEIKKLEEELQARGQ
ncbi:unnamed protein product [Clonostachys rosea]|uniref:Uncharacterized protein n=1 Tax=Bionectria ochroleuca TaxID=29856 RepID=A0ABY6UFY2_BIOOC|nr:unnamed protein product [Clonostachys rosea]